MLIRPLIALVFSLAATTVAADPPVVVDASASQTGTSWRVDVTLSHADTGWDDYADGWRVETEDGSELGLRVLAHPHVNEQPFTRSLTGIEIPDATAEVFIRARSNTDGWSDSRFRLSLPQG